MHLDARRRATAPERRLRAVERGGDLVARERALAQHLPRAVAAVGAQVDDRRGVPGSVPPSTTRSAPSRSAGSTSSSERGSAPPDRLALDCMTGTLTSASTPGRGHAQAERPRVVPAGQRVAGERVGQQQRDRAGQERFERAARAGAELGQRGQRAVAARRT